MASSLFLLVCAVAVGQIWACSKCGDMNHRPDYDMMQMMYMMKQQGGNSGGYEKMDYEAMLRKEREEQAEEAEKIQEKFDEMLDKFKEQKHTYAKTMLAEMIKACQCQRSIMQGAPALLTKSFMKDSMEDMVGEDWTPESGEELKKHFFMGLFSNLCGSVHGFLERVTLINTRVEALEAGLTTTTSVPIITT